LPHFPGNSKSTGGKKKGSTNNLFVRGKAAKQLQKVMLQTKKKKETRPSQSGGERGTGVLLK